MKQKQTGPENRFLVTSFFLLLLTSCNYSAPKQTNSDTGLNTGTVPSFVEVTDAVLRPKCLKCHTAPDGKGGVNLDSHNGFLANKTLVKDAVESGSMPPSGPLPADQMTFLLNWIANGAPLESMPLPTKPGGSSGDSSEGSSCDNSEDSSGDNSEGSSCDDSEDSSSESWDHVFICKNLGGKEYKVAPRGHRDEVGFLYAHIEVPTGEQLKAKIELRVDIQTGVTITYRPSTPAPDKINSIGITNLDSCIEKGVCPGWMTGPGQGGPSKCRVVL